MIPISVNGMVARHGVAKETGANAALGHVLNAAFLFPLAVAILGIGARWYVSTLGYTQDLNYLRLFIRFIHERGWMGAMQWDLVHFGPVLPVLWVGLSWLPISFGTALVAAYTAIDGAIAWFLWRRINGLAATLFFLNPVLIIVTGYQRVSEQVALGLGLAAVCLAAYPVLAAAILGISLAAKHDLLLLPLWLAIGTQRSMVSRLSWLVIPYVIFAAAILPFPDMWHRVVSYQSTNNAPLWAAINPADINGRIGWRYLFIGALLLSGLWYCNRTPVEQFCLYCISLVAFSTAMANHYLTIPLIGLAIGWNRWAAAYIIVGTTFECASDQGLHIGWLENVLHVSGDGTGSVPWYRLMCLMLLLHLATRPTPIEAPS